MTRQRRVKLDAFSSLQESRTRHRRLTGITVFPVFEAINAIFSWTFSAELFRPRGEPPTVRLQWLAYGSSLFFLNDRFSKFLSCVRASPA